MSSAAVVIGALRVKMPKIETTAESSEKVETDEATDKGALHLDLHS